MIVVRFPFKLVPISLVILCWKNHWRTMAVLRAISSDEQWSSLGQLLSILRTLPLECLCTQYGKKFIYSWRNTMFSSWFSRFISWYTFRSRNIFYCPFLYARISYTFLLQQLKFSKQLILTCRKSSSFSKQLIRISLWFFMSFRKPVFFKFSGKLFLSLYLVRRCFT